NLPPALSHSALVASVKPLPLQAFWPAQALLAPLQALWPLQALAPIQCPLASSAAICIGALTAAPAISRTAAAAARAAPELMSIFMIGPPMFTDVALVDWRPGQNDDARAVARCAAA